MDLCCRAVSVRAIPTSQSNNGRFEHWSEAKNAPALSTNTDDKLIKCGFEPLEICELQQSQETRITISLEQMLTYNRGHNDAVI